MRILYFPREKIPFFNVQYISSVLENSSEKQLYFIPRTVYNPVENCFTTKIGKATLFIHGLCLKLEACGAVYIYETNTK